jgi:hypothetical protein
MVIEIPQDFDIHNERLDPFEMYICDDLKVNILSWAKFRHTIHAGTHATHLASTDGSEIRREVKEAYRELGKSHYTVVRSLGWAKASLLYADGTLVDHWFFREKGMRDFYLYLGRMLDNLARLIYIITADLKSLTKTIQSSGETKLYRHRILWGNLVGMKERKALANYRPFIQSQEVEEIRNVRHVLTHSWAVPMDRTTMEFKWPRAIRTESDFLWHLDPEEIEIARIKYPESDSIPVTIMMKDDFAFIEGFQSQVFEQLTRDVPRFEKTHNIEIRVSPS